MKQVPNKKRKTQVSRIYEGKFVVVGKMDKKKHGKVVEILEKLGATVQNKWVSHGSEESEFLVYDTKEDELYKHVDKLGGRSEHVECVFEKFEEACKASVVTSILPNVFDGFHFYVDPSLDDNASLERYLIAYNADVSECLTERVTHVISQKKRAEYSEKDIINPQFVWDSINDKKLMPIKEYKL